MTMFLSGSMLSGSSGGGGGGLQFGQQDNFTVHALRRDDDGMLRYTKVKTTDESVVDVSHRLDGTQYPDFLDGVECKWGSAVGYLQEIGVTHEQMDAVRHNFLE